MKKDIYRIAFILYNGDALKAEEYHKKSGKPHRKIYLEGLRRVK